MVKKTAKPMKKKNATKYHGAEYISLIVLSGSKLQARRNSQPIRMR